jgi:hypothetical protein
MFDFIYWDICWLSMLQSFWILFLLLVFLKGGAIIAFIIFMVTLCSLMIFIGIIGYAFLLLILSVGIIMILWFIYYLSEYSLVYKSNLRLRIIYFNFNFFCFFGCILFIYLFITPEIFYDRIINISVKINCYIDSYLWIGLILFISCSITFIWFFSSPNLVTYSLNHLILTYCFFSLSIDLVLLGLLSGLLFIIPVSLKHWLSRNRSAVTLRWREEIDRFHSDSYECGITNDKINLKTNQNLIKVFVLSGLFILLDIELIILVYLYLVVSSRSLMLMIALLPTKIYMLMRILR